MTSPQHPTPTDEGGPERAEQDEPGDPGRSNGPTDHPQEGVEGTTSNNSSDAEPDARRRAMTVAGSAPGPPPRRTGLFVDPHELRAHVGELLAGMLGGYEVDGFGNFSFTHDGARIFVTVGPTPVGLAVNVHSVTNIDLDLSDDLARFLATTNHRLGFGALSYDTDNRAVWMRQTLLGTALDAPELQAAVATVARTAAGMDDEVQRRFGGRTFDGATPDEQAAAAPPTAADESSDQPDRERDNASGYL